jgi:cell fate regulator YaaT (PSP1 superfamily)
VGLCGRELCCCSFLNEFIPVSIKMAKEQNLSMNPAKISGCCGRLMCCLKYEQEAYEDAHSRMPRPGHLVMTPEGPGMVEGINLLKETVTVRLDRGGEADLVTLPNADVSITGGKPCKHCSPGGGSPRQTAAPDNNGGKKHRPNTPPDSSTEISPRNLAD